MWNVLLSEHACVYRCMCTRAVWQGTERGTPLISDLSVIFSVSNLPLWLHQHCGVRAVAYPEGPRLGGFLARRVLQLRVGSAAVAAAAGPGALSQHGSRARGVGAPSLPPSPPIFSSPPLCASLHPPPPRPALPYGGRVPANHSSSGRYLNKPRNPRRTPTPPQAEYSAPRAPRWSITWQLRHRKSLMRLRERAR